MNIMPINNIKFGGIFATDVKYSDSQNQIINEIKETLNQTAPFDKKKRSYNEYIDKYADCDVFLAPEKDDKIKTYVVMKPISHEGEDLRKHGIIQVTDNCLAGIYDKKHPFNIDDVMSMVKDNIEYTKDIVIGSIAPVATFAAVVALAVFLRFCNPKSHDSKVIERAAQDTTMIVKDTVKMFK